MRIFIVLMFVAPLAFAQTQTATSMAAGCGPAQVKFKVTSDKRSHPAGQPDSGKVLVYFIQDDTKFESTPRPTTRIGIDGTWVGATRTKSYFYVSVDPGEHHVCASWQSFVGIGAAHTAAAVHLTAVAGQTYYFMVRNSWPRHPSKRGDIELVPLDDAQGQLLASESAFTASRQK